MVDAGCKAGRQTKVQANFNPPKLKILHNLDFRKKHPITTAQIH